MPKDVGRPPKKWHVPPAPIYSRAVERKFMKAAKYMPEAIRIRRMLLWYSINDPSNLERKTDNRQAFIDALREHPAAVAVLISIVARGPDKDEHLEDWILSHPEVAAPDFFRDLTTESFDARPADEKAVTVSASPLAIKRRYEAATGRKTTAAAVQKALKRIHRRNGGV